MNAFKQVYKAIKRYNVIVLARHIGADPDALGSTLGLKEAIKYTFKNKQVYAIGTPASKHRYIGELDEFNQDTKNALLIVLDTPDKKRIDGANPDDYGCVIKIDHHPFVEKFGDIEIIDDKASSAAQLVIEFIFKTRMKINKEAAKKLYIGVVGDTNRFLFSYTSTKTFDLVSKMIKETDIDFTSLYEKMYVKSLKEARFQGYVVSHLTVTENGLGYIKMNQELLDELDIDVATATNSVNSLNYIDGMYTWVVIAQDTANDNIRVSIRSRGPIINEVAVHFNGGGHIYASGARIKTFEEADALIKELDDVCLEYKNNL